MRFCGRMRLIMLYNRTIIEQIIAHKGCVVPEAAIHKKGCSRTKRKGQSGSRLSPAVSAVVRQRAGELRAKAEQLAVGSK